MKLFEEILYLFIVYSIKNVKTSFVRKVKIFDVSLEQNFPSMELKVWIEVTNVKTGILLHRSNWHSLPKSNQMIIEIISKDYWGINVLLTMNYTLFSNENKIISGTTRAIVNFKNKTNHTFNFDFLTMTLGVEQDCTKDHYGINCDFCKEQDNKTGHFNCLEEGGIQCKEGWLDVENNCTKPFCPVCQYGSCLEPYNCSCYKGYQGEGCEVCVPFPGCFAGFCGKPDQCICYVGWKGKYCSERIEKCIEKKHECLNNGKCLIRNYVHYCLCDSNFIGSRCEFNKTKSVLCINKSYLVKNEDSEYCFCQPTFTGKNCGFLRTFDSEILDKRSEEAFFSHFASLSSSERSFAHNLIIYIGLILPSGGLLFIFLYFRKSNIFSF